MSDAVERVERPAEGASSHGEGCVCVRCTGFTTANASELGKRGGRPLSSGGAYSGLTLPPRAAELAAWIRRVGRHLTEDDEVEVQRAALVLAKSERAVGVLVEVDEAMETGVGVDVLLERMGRRGSLSSDARGWLVEARRTLDGLALTPAGRAALKAAEEAPGIDPAEVRELILRTLEAALEFVDRERRREFDARVDSLVRALPSAGEPEAP